VQGPDGKLLSRVVNPFITMRTSRKAGRGIALLKGACEKASGELEIETAKEETASLQLFR
jgi:nitrogen fixation/metabolism regulation signal transduction histidine kinase